MTDTAGQQAAARQVVARDGGSLSSSSGEPYILLRPVKVLPRKGEWFGRIISGPEELRHVLAGCALSEFVALDYETTGSDYTDPSFYPVGLGLAWDSGSVYLPWENMPAEDREQVRRMLYAHQGLLAHNQYFDSGVAQKEFGEPLRLYACTLTVLGHTASEGYPGSGGGHGLKNAMVRLLGWPDSNERDLDLWLILNGYYKGGKRKDETSEGLTSAYDSGSLKPDKSQMYRAPVEILGQYCCLDSDACYLLWLNVLRPITEQFSGLKRYLVGQDAPVNVMTQLLIWQKMVGMLVDRAGMQERVDYLAAEAEQLRLQFLENPRISSHVAAIIQEDVKTGLLDVPPKLQKRKDGSFSALYVKWLERCQIAQQGKDPSYTFNVQSAQQMTRLLYGKLEMPVRIKTEGTVNKEPVPAVSVAALRQMGEVTAPLVKRLAIQKERSYLEAYMEMTTERPTLHPSFRIPGTRTGRLSSNSPNLQQIPKSKEVMGLFPAHPGYVLTDTDFAALESVVAAELSEDPSLLALYGNGVPANDLHLHVAAQVPGEMGAAVLATGYTPFNPPAGTVEKAKKEAKHWRQIAKVVVYACQYGAGVDTVMAQLEEAEVYLDREQVAIIHSTYWAAFAQLKQYSRDLQREARRNGGYILNALGRPMPIPEERNHDALSRMVQSTGHDILVWYISFVVKRLDAEQIDYIPYVINWHDSVALQVRVGQEERVREIYGEALWELNQFLGGNIQLKGAPTIGPTLAVIKEAE